MQNFFTVTFSLLASAITNSVTMPFSQSLLEPSTQVSIIQKDETPIAVKEISPEKSKVKRIICKGCNENENVALEYFQKVGIKDKNALAVIMGNIRQESTFVPNICEGGGIKSYHSCWGGYGLIQWTSSDRYYGLGDFAKRTASSPSNMLTQLKYLISEVQWKNIEEKMKSPGKSIDRYMKYSYDWIGWGIHGARTSYAYNYLNRMIEVEI